MSVNDAPPQEIRAVERMETGIPGVDALTYGGLPINRASVICGTPGSGKTVLCAQFLIEGIRAYDQPGVFVAFEESPEDIRQNLAGFGWDVPQFEADRQWLFVDGSQRSDEHEVFFGGDFNLEGLRTRIVEAVRKLGAKRVSLDSLAAVFSRFPDPGIIRRELFRLTSSLKEIETTCLFTAELVETPSDLTRFGVEEFVADAVVILRNNADLTRRRRTMEILKMRGGTHSTGEFPFSIGSSGISALPLGTVELRQPSSDTRITSGCAALDKMCGGGFFRDSVTIVSGATGTGKTLTAMQFLKGAAQRGEKAAFFGYEESRPQLVRNALAWGIDLQKLEDEGRLQIHCQLPESASLEDHLVRIRDALDHFRPNRIALDSITAMQRIGSLHAYREFTIGLTTIIKERQIAGLYTSTSNRLYGAASVTEQHISTVTDAIILLRYVEQAGEMRRGIAVLKMRGSGHDKAIREYTITNRGIEIGSAFTNMTGILGGSPSVEPEFREESE